MRNDRATIARISTAEDLAALASALAECVMFMTERGPSRADEEELIRILRIATKLKTIARTLRAGEYP